MRADGGGALIYIILAVLSLVINAISQNNKKKAQRSVSSGNPVDTEDSQPEPQPSWQQELEEIFGKKYNQPEERKPAEEIFTYEEIKPEEESRSSQEIIYSREAEEELKEINSGEIATVGQPLMVSEAMEIVELDEEQSYRSDVLTEFDLRKAVIYTEVFNRKYF